MALMNDRIRGEARKALAKMAGPVRLVLFTQEADAAECEFCAETRELAEELSKLSDKVALEVHDFKTDRAAVEQYGIDKIPALAVVGAKDYGVRFYGIPSGYEFATLLETLVRVSSNESGLSPAMKKQVAEIGKPVHLQVFVTPT